MANGSQSKLICPGKQGVVRPRARRRKEKRENSLAPSSLASLLFYFGLFLGIRRGFLGIYYFIF